MKKRVLLALIAVVFLLSLALVGCQPGGIAQEVYDQVAEQLSKAKEQLAKVQDEKGSLQTAKSTIEAQLQEARSTIAQLQNQLGESGLVGSTPAETAEKIVKYYHETHVYSTYDLFICSDMAGEVWNMLKAQGIESIVVVGNINVAITDILQCNHAWVLAEVAPGEYLALETTGGRVIRKGENPLYYRGWYFNSPADLKNYNNMVRGYNTLVGVRNRINEEANEVAEEHNRSTDPVTADKLKAIYDKLVELRGEQEAALNEIMAEINSLAKKCGT